MPREASYIQYLETGPQLVRGVRGEGWEGEGCPVRQN